MTSLLDRVAADIGRLPPGLAACFHEALAQARFATEACATYGFGRALQDELHNKALHLAEGVAAAKAIARTRGDRPGASTRQARRAFG